MTRGHTWKGTKNMNARCVVEVISGELRVKCGGKIVGYCGGCRGLRPRVKRPMAKRIIRVRDWEVTWNLAAIIPPQWRNGTRTSAPIIFQGGDNESQLVRNLSKRRVIFGAIIVPAEC